MDPITAIGIATTAFNAIKKGIEIGREVESMSSDIGRWMGAISDVKTAAERAKNPPLFKKMFDGASIEQEAIEAFAAKKKAEAMENELRVFIQFNYGMNAWNEILRIQAQIRKDRAEAKKKREEYIENVILVTGVVLIIALSSIILGVVIYNI